MPSSIVRAVLGVVGAIVARRHALVACLLLCCVGCSKPEPVVVAPPSKPPPSVEQKRAEILKLKELGDRIAFLKAAAESTEVLYERARLSADAKGERMPAELAEILEGTLESIAADRKAVSAELRKIVTAALKERRQPETRWRDDAGDASRDPTSHDAGWGFFTRKLR